MKKQGIMLLSACFMGTILFSGCSAEGIVDRLMGNTNTVSVSEPMDLSDDQNAVTVDDSLQKPVFSVNPEGSVQYEIGDTAEPIICEASVSDGGTISYQWYKNNVNSNGGGTLIEGATENRYVPSASEEGKSYYYAVVTNTKEKKVSMATSSVMEIVVVAKGQWIQDGTGWWYQNADGSYPVSCWKKIDQIWYAFNESGYMRTGWYQEGDSWYYLGTDGGMKTGWVTVDGSEYYLDPESGRMAHDTTMDGFQIDSSGRKMQ